MAVRNNNIRNQNGLLNNLWQKVQQDSVSWGSLALLVCGLVVLLVIVAIFSYT
ncbi:MAG: hypothetical protein ACHBN1_38015 [Heteroscytonema crispum UTEX LB 1556]